jgi:hypothetical protein
MVRQLSMRSSPTGMKIIRRPNNITPPLQRGYDNVDGILPDPILLKGVELGKRTLYPGG